MISINVSITFTMTMVITIIASTTSIITISSGFLFGARGSGHFQCVVTTLEGTFPGGQGIQN